MAEEKKNVSKRNWADEEDDGAEEEDVEIGGSTVAQVGQPQASDAAKTEGESQPEQRTFVPNKPRTKRERNIYGDFVVTKINIKEREIPVPEPAEGEEEEESSEESEEEEQPVPEPEEEVKKGKFIDWHQCCSQVDHLCGAACSKRASLSSSLFLSFEQSQ